MIINIIAPKCCYKKMVTLIQNLGESFNLGEQQEIIDNEKSQ